MTTDTHATLFVNAGAGAGKTRALVDRISTLVLTDGVPMLRIAAVTFTERAGAELRDRLRATFEDVWRDERPENAERRQRAAVGTLHSFAQRILTEPSYGAFVAGTRSTAASLGARRLTPCFAMCVTGSVPQEATALRKACLITTPVDQRTHSTTRPWRRAAIAGTAAGSLTLAACAPDGTGNGNGTDGDPVEGGGSVSVYLGEPQFLTPGESTEVMGSQVLEQLFTGLTSIDYDTNEAIPGVAEDWETDDNITWTFDLGEDWTFHNGESLTAESFVETWNWTVDPDNAQQNAGFFDNILGYEDVAEGEADELEGVTAVDDHTLEVELNEPFAPFAEMLSYTAFYPLPDEAFEDIDAFESAPIGNGQYQMDGEWEHDVSIHVERFEDWAGEDPGNPERIEWEIYTDLDTAYLDVQAGELDVLPQAPPSQYPTLDEDFGDNWTASETSSYTYLGLPLYQEEFEDVEVRHAISKAIDREEIMESIFDGRRTAAYNIIPPTLPQGREDACGENCEFDPEAASEMYEDAGGPSELTLYFNAGDGHEDWMEAVSNQLQLNLGIEDISFETMEFAQYLDLQQDREITGPYRLGWVLSYPSPQYAMEPIYTTGAASNYFEYSSEEFDDLIDEANSAVDEDEADELYMQAEDVLLEDMPGVPLFFQDYNAVYTDAIDGDSINVDPRTFLRVEELVVTQQ